MHILTVLRFKVEFSSDAIDVCLLHIYIFFHQQKSPH